MSPAAVQEYAGALVARYQVASKGEKGRLLAEFCATTGMHRKAAIRLLARRRTRVSARTTSARPRRGRPPRYGPDLLPALTTLWAVSGLLSGKLLVGAIAQLIPKLERAGAMTVTDAQRTALLTMSAATIDRLLQGERRARVVQPQRRGSVLTASFRQQVPIRTWQEWQDVRPGEIQADLVLHCGDTTAGRSLATLTVIDVATGWVELHPLLRLTQDRVEAALTEVRKRLPMSLTALHTDNGSEFLNHLVLGWCRRYGLSGSRGRPYRKNDQAWVEQANWSTVREVVGYARFESKAALGCLGRLELLIAEQHNFVRPRRKLIEKVRNGARVTKRYDTPQTPYQRLLASDGLSPEQRTALIARFERCNPLALASAMTREQALLWTLATSHPDLRPLRVG